MPRDFILSAFLRLIAQVLAPIFESAPKPPLSNYPFRQWKLVPSILPENHSQWICVQRKKAESELYCMRCFVHQARHIEDSSTCKRIQEIFTFDGRCALFVAMTLNWPEHELNGLNRLIKYATGINNSDKRIWIISMMFANWHNLLQKNPFALRIIAASQELYLQDPTRKFDQWCLLDAPNPEIELAAPIAAPATWVCPDCTLENAINRNFCEICDAKRC
jgi:hypothetical protein